jgi:hypothetical protein
MTVVQARARTYARAAGARFLPLGFDMPEAEPPLVAAMAAVRERVGDVDEAWCATGSGMLARCLALAFPKSRVIGVVVGLESRNSLQAMPANCELRRAPYAFEKRARSRAPFPSCANYDAKAWEALSASPLGPSKTRLFWNVLG